MIKIKKLFIINPNAGSVKDSNLIEDIKETYKKNKREDEYEIVITTEDDHGIDDVKKFIDSKVDEEKVVIIVGGDGSLNEMAQVLGGTDTALGFIPAGTANDFSKNFNYDNFKIEDTFTPKISPIDLIEVNGEKCINVMSLGFDTQILNTAYEIMEKNPRIGEKAFTHSVLKNIFNLQYEKLNIKLKLQDGKAHEINEEFVIFALCNGGFYGSGFNPAPFSKLDDGYLNLVLARKLNIFELFPLIFKYKNGTHLGHKKISEYIVESGVVSSEKEFLYNLDGEINRAKKLEFKVLKDDLKFAYVASVVKKEK